jgi:hypothetical protein
MALHLPNKKAGIRNEITEYADQKNCFSSGTKRARMDALFENLGKDMANCPDTPKMVIALISKYRHEVDQIAST